MKKYLTDLEVAHSIKLKPISEIAKKIGLSKEVVDYRIKKLQKEYIIKGFTMNDEKLKDPYNIFGKDYFEEQLARIRNIRSSERNFYQKVTDIYATSIDYKKDDAITRQFFATV